MPPAPPAAVSGPLASTGIAGLDDILGGGLTRDRVYLVEGTPGTGKTTLSLQFLLTGAAQGECGLYITLSETAVELHAVAASHGWSLRDITLYELMPETGLDPDSEQSVLHPSEIELGETTREVMARVEALHPAPRGVRQPVRAAPADPEPAALPPADPGAEAVFRQPPLHGTDAGRPHVRTPTICSCTASPMA